MRANVALHLMAPVGIALFLLGGREVQATTTINLVASDVTGLAEAIDAYDNNTDDYVINLTQSTYTLTSPLPVIGRFGSGLGGNNSSCQFNAPCAGSLVINGNGAILQRNTSASNFGIFDVVGTTFTLNDLTVKSGLSNSGGAIYADTGCYVAFCFFPPCQCADVTARISLNRCTFVNNSSGGAIVIGRESQVTMTGCTFRQNFGSVAGAVSNYGSLTATGCTFDGNIGVMGGAICNDPNQGTCASNSTCPGTVSLANCTFHNNSATNEGGAVYSDGKDQGYTGSVTITNCTFSGNNTPGPGQVIENASFGSCSCDATVTMLNNIFQGGTSDALANSLGQITSQGHNISDQAESGGAGTGPGGFLNGPADLRNTNANLGSLGNNGGPTQTVSLLASSPAIKAGDISQAPSRDQRGYIRSGPPDIGAFEFNGAILKLDGVSIDVAGDVFVTVEVVQGLTYHLQRSFDLDPNSFANSPAAAPLTATGNDTEQLEDNGTAHLFSSYFYRVTSP